ncbi:hypothetical protein SLS56_012220 [Neofusicoccum ribis]|uniref:Uncharacterized protein n=1 Tax=Neofusicoccum ribis TaxID=45134 RepID=A0ABR3S9E8_9PEZI
MAGGGEGGHGGKFSSGGSAWDFDKEEEDSACGGGDAGGGGGSRGSGSGSGSSSRTSSSSGGHGGGQGSASSSSQCSSSQDSSRTSSSQGNSSSRTSSSQNSATSSSGQGSARGSGQGSARGSSGRSGRSEGGSGGGQSSSGQDSARDSGQGSARGSSGRSERSRRSQMKMSCLELVTKIMDSFIIRGSYSPIQWILDLRTYGMKIHYNTTTKGHELLFSHGHGHKKEYGEMDVPAVPWDSIRDNPAEERRGWSFLQDQRTRLLVDGNTWLFNRIMKDAAARNRFTRKNTSSGISRQAVDAYAAQVAEFREKLLLLMHITGGQPARGPEILSIRHSNAAKGGHRNIFVEDGLVVFVTRYYKGYAMSGDVKVIYRYLPREVGELVVWYLWLVLPFH